MNRDLILLVGLALLASLVPAGCSRGPREVSVRGEVNLDNVPLAQGSIRFAPLDGSTTTQAAMIKDGKFETRLQCTTYRVEISSPRILEKPRKPTQGAPGDDDPFIEERIPTRYNLHSKLQLEVNDKQEDVRYDLESK